jgi:hypothetical protein
VALAFIADQPMLAVDIFLSSGLCPFSSSPAGAAGAAGAAGGGAAAGFFSGAAAEATTSGVGAAVDAPQPICVRGWTKRRAECGRARR